MTSLLSDMRTVRPQGPTFRITQPYGLRDLYLGMPPSFRKGLSRIFPGYHVYYDIHTIRAFAMERTLLRYNS